MSEKKSYQVEYSALYWVLAESEEEAIELAIEDHAKNPDGDWSAHIEPSWPDTPAEMGA